jgi:hypothetical protein
VISTFLKAAFLKFTRKMPPWRRCQVMFSRVNRRGFVRMDGGAVDEDGDVGYLDVGSESF